MDGIRKFIKSSIFVLELNYGKFLFISLQNVKVNDLLKNLAEFKHIFSVDYFAESQQRLK